MKLSVSGQMFCVHPDFIGAEELLWVLLEHRIEIADQVLDFMLTHPQALCFGMCRGIIGGHGGGYGGDLLDPETGRVLPEPDEETDLNLLVAFSANTAPEMMAIWYGEQQRRLHLCGAKWRYLGRGPRRRVISDRGDPLLLAVQQGNLSEDVRDLVHIAANADENPLVTIAWLQQGNREWRAQAIALWPGLAGAMVADHEISDAIDQGQKLVPVLAERLRTSTAAIKSLMGECYEQAPIANLLVREFEQSRPAPVEVSVTQLIGRIQGDAKRNVQPMNPWLMTKLTMDTLKDTDVPLVANSNLFTEGYNSCLRADMLELLTDLPARQSNELFRNQGWVADYMRFDCLRGVQNKSNLIDNVKYITRYGNVHCDELCLKWSQFRDFVQVAYRSISGQDEHWLSDSLVAKYFGEGSLATLMKVSAEWHQQVPFIVAERRRLLCDGDDVLSQALDGWPAPSGDWIASNGVTLHWLCSEAELEAEGAEMRHCVGTYVDRCHRGDSIIAGVTTPDGERSTVEFFVTADETDRQHLQIRQHHSVRNTAPCKASREAVDEFLAHRQCDIDLEAFGAEIACHDTLREELEKQLDPEKEREIDEAIFEKFFRRWLHPSYRTLPREQLMKEIQGVGDGAYFDICFWQAKRWMNRYVSSKEVVIRALLKEVTDALAFLRRREAGDVGDMTGEAELHRETIKVLTAIILGKTEDMIPAALNLRDEKSLFLDSTLREVLFDLPDNGFYAQVDEPNDYDPFEFEDDCDEPNDPDPFEFEDDWVEDDAA
jgi:hypothetical protein